MTTESPDLAKIAKSLKARNAANKRRIMHHRRNLAIARSHNAGIAHTGKFPSKYKYG